MKIDLYERFGLYIMSDVAGRRLASEIRSALESGDDVIVDFANVKSVLTAFLNPAIGDLYAVFDADELDRRVRTVNTSDVNDASLERVRDHARQFYNDPGSGSSVGPWATLRSSSASGRIGRSASALRETSP